MSRQTKDENGRIILFENESIRITKLLHRNPENYQFMIWEKNGEQWQYKQTVTDWNTHD